MIKAIAILGAVLMLGCATMQTEVDTLTDEGMVRDFVMVYLSEYPDKKDNLIDATDIIIGRLQLYSDYQVDRQIVDMIGTLDEPEQRIAVRLAYLTLRRRGVEIINVRGLVDEEVSAFWTNIAQIVKDEAEKW